MRRSWGSQLFTGPYKYKTQVKRSSCVASCAIDSTAFSPPGLHGSPTALVLGSSVIFLAGFLFCSKRARRTASQFFRYNDYSHEQQTSIIASTSSEGIYGALENGEKVEEK
ncbi:unnamed protein product [Amoebophrya sp. A25]|nr:unnamed protein product [Amoebophrya sp. A25]|eukprot:GSA25T00014717001.1